jgi:hypothetical protein
VNVAIFGGFEKRPFAPGWTKETLVSVFGGGELDLTQSPPGDGAKLTAITLFGGIELLVAPGTAVALSGFSLFGGRSVDVTQGDGPRFDFKAIAIFGGIEVKEQAQPVAA